MHEYRELYFIGNSSLSAYKHVVQCTQTHVQEVVSIDRYIYVLKSNWYNRFVKLPLLKDVTVILRYHVGLTGPRRLLNSLKLKKCVLVFNLVHLSYLQMMFVFLSTFLDKHIIERVLWTIYT